MTERIKQESDQLRKRIAQDVEQANQFEEEKIIEDAEVAASQIDEEDEKICEELEA